MDKQDEEPCAIYGVACQLNLEDEDYRVDPGQVFFVTFTTRNEDEAIELAKTFCGSTQRAKSSLILFGKDGTVY